MKLTQSLKAVLVVGSVLIILLAVFGGFQSYSPVPYWDMWDGELDFYFELKDGNLGALWDQHNEHRIILTRLIFLLDLDLFGGSSAFLIFCNYLLVSSICVTFAYVLLQVNKGRHSARACLVTATALSAWLFLWSQKENLIWAFQNMFWLVQLLPLLAFIFLAKDSGHGSVRNKWFWLALSFGVLSVGGMANGLFALPILGVLAVSRGFEYRRIGIIILSSAICFFLYFHQYVSPVGHGSFTKSLLSQPMDLFVFACGYLGSPLYYLVGGGQTAQHVSVLSGFVLIAASGVTALGWLGAKDRSPWVGALLAFIMFVGISAFVTAGGRLMFGLETAFSSRYTTPALMAWAALFCIYSPYIISVFGKSGPEKLAAVLIVAVLSVPVLHFQVSALTSSDQVRDERRIAALALELGIHDDAFIQKVYPNTDLALAIASKASAENISVFGLPPYRDISEQIGAVYEPEFSEFRVCAGHVDEIERFDGSSKFVRVRGWLFNEKLRRTPTSIQLVDSQGMLVGYALSGMQRPDVASAIDPKASQAGFTGYVLSSTAAESLTLVAPDVRCRMGGKYQREFAVPVALPPTSDSVTVSSGSVLDSVNWPGADYYGSQMDGLQILGSFVSADSDTGKIHIRIKPGDRLLYRSGPTAGQQTLGRTGHSTEYQVLPIALDWITLEFPAANFDGDEAEFEFSDSGAEFGEWSAIAILSPTETLDDFQD